MSVPEDRLKLIAHIREQIARDPHAYANDAKMRLVAARFLESLTCGSEHATVRDRDDSEDVNEDSSRPV